MILYTNSAQGGPDTNLFQEGDTGKFQPIDPAKEAAKAILDPNVPTTPQEETMLARMITGESIQGDSPKVQVNIAAYDKLFEGKTDAEATVDKLTLDLAQNPNDPDLKRQLELAQDMMRKENITQPDKDKPWWKFGIKLSLYGDFYIFML